MTSIFRKRLKLLTRTLLREVARCSGPAALLVGSAARRVSSGDQLFPFRQTSDLIYLTGSSHEELLLFISPKAERPQLIVPPVNKTKVLWEGKPPDLRGLAEDLDAELVVTATPEKEVLSRLRGVQRLYFQNDSESRAWAIAQRLIREPTHSRGTLPSEFVHSDVLTTPMRLFKDSSELKLIRTAAKVTNEALLEVLPMIQPGVPESLIASTIDFFFRTRGCEPGFSTNVSSGPSAATLHHAPSDREIKAGELVLIDCGASYRHYSADITRVVPADGSFTPIQRLLYQAVLEAQKAAIKRIRHGALIRDVYLAAARPLTEALVEARVLRGKVTRLIERKAFAPYFPHGIGHTLGLDVHDVGNLRGNTEATLQVGMVFTVEPGLYFPRAIGRIPAGLGIRIEDDVLVTKRGCEILTEGFPKNTKQVQDLLKSAHPSE